MSENMSMLTSGILGMSVLVALIASFVISYAIRFMLEQRKKEFATYELLGMETSNIQKLFFIENGVIGMAAFFIGTFQELDFPECWYRLSTIFLRCHIPIVFPFP